MSILNFEMAFAQRWHQKPNLKPHSKLKTQNSKLKTQNSKLKTQN